MGARSRSPQFNNNLYYTSRGIVSMLAIVATSHRLASCVIVSGFRAALDLDTYPLSAHYAYNLAFSLVLLSLERSRFKQICHISVLALVALKLLVSLISRPVACSARIVVDRQTQTYRTTTVTLAAHARRGLMRAPEL